MEINKVYCGDCKELLKQIPDESVDLVLTDPAYKVTSRGSGGSMSGYWVEKKTMQGEIFETNDIEIEDYIHELYRVLKDRSHCYIMTNNYNLPHFLKVITEQTDFHFIKSVIWDKKAVICGKYYMGAYEHILFLRKGGDRAINDCGTPDILSIGVGEKPKDKDGLINPTAKPDGLFEVLIENSSNKGDLVLDPFMGSGTLARACKNTGRNYIGFDIDQRQVEWVNKSMDNYNKQLSLF